jgi:hypothetical protein
MRIDFHLLESDVLECMRRGDLTALATMLSDDFLITTAGWISEPATRAEWLDELSTSAAMETAVLHSVTTRTYEGCVVAFVLSSQTGTLRGVPFDMDFRYTDIWIPGRTGRWLLDVRHAGIVARR